MLDLLKSVGSFLSPMSAGIGMVGDALGLPKEITSAIKTVAGAATGNMVMAADGVAGLVSELASNPPARTEFSAARDPALAGEGYAKASQSPTNQGAQGTHAASAASKSSGGILDPITLDYRDALRQLCANFDLLEGTERSGSKNGKIDTGTLLNAANNARLPQGLREACRFFINNPAFRNMLDTAGKGGKVDGTISMKDVQAALAKVLQDIARFGVRTPPQESQQPSGGTPSTPGTGGAPSTSGNSGTEGTSGTGGTSSPAQGASASPLDPNFGEFRAVLGILDANYRTFDAAVGKLDEFLSRDNLRNINENPNASAQLKRVAEFFLAHPEYYDRLEMSAGVGGRDGVVGWADVKAAIAQADADIAKYGLPAAGGTSGTTGSGATTSTGGTGGTTGTSGTGATSGTSASSGTGATSGTGSVSGSGGTSGARPAGPSIRDILNNPRMSIEEKLQAILMALTERLDDELLQTMDDLAAAQDQRAGIANTQENQKALKDAERNAEMINLRLQNLMEKRKAMFDLMSNISSKFNEMAKTAINNLRNA